MVQLSHEMWGFGVIGLLICILIFKAIMRRMRTDRTGRTNDDVRGGTSGNLDIEHRALMYLMAEKTDSLLRALAQTIEQERQKLGGVVRNPSMEDALERLQAVSTTAEENRFPNYDSVHPLMQQGMDAEAIARQLRIPEEEVTLVMRLKAA